MDIARRFFGPISGIVFATAIFGAEAVVGGFDTEPSDSASTVLAELREKSDEVQLAGFMTMLGAGLLLVFLGHLRTSFREGGAGWAADGFFAGGVAMVSAWIVLVGVQLAGGVAGESGHPEVAQGAIDFMWEGSLLYSPGLLAVGATAAVVSLVHRVLPVWLGVFAVVVALGALAPWVGVFVFVLWVLAASIVELGRAFADRRTTADLR